jgi:hypothetical protein
MTKQLRAVAAALLAVGISAGAASAGARKTAPAGPVPGEDQYRSATGYTVAVMEHCKAINKLARAKGDFNLALAREHAEEVARNASSASRHLKGYVAALGTDRRGQVVAHTTVEGASDDAVQRFAAALTDALGVATPDRKAVSQAATDLYLAAKDLMAAHKTAGKTLGIRAATPPRRAVPRKPKPPKEGATMAKDTNR